MSPLLAGFADPVRDSQSAFRAVMDAMARPGRVHRIAGLATPPPPLDEATGAVLLTLVDAETTLWLDAASAAAGEWIAFHCGAKRAVPDQAQFAVAIGDVALGRFHAGTDEEPEGSTTVIVQVSALGSGETLALSGPGLQGEQSLEIAGLPPGFRDQWAANARTFPRGVDVILCAGAAVAALPRTVRIG